MLKFLKRITLHEDKNKMSASNLGTIFATHLMCPRKLSAESLQSNHQLYASAVAFMIEHADVLFHIPDKVVQDVLAHSSEGGRPTAQIRSCYRPPAFVQR